MWSHCFSVYTNAPNFTCNMIIGSGHSKAFSITTQSGVHDRELRSPLLAAVTKSETVS